MAVYVTGDMHGDENKMSELITQMDSGDTGLVAGDFGFMFLDDKSENIFLDDLSNACANKGIDIAFVLGNHENYDVYYSDRFPIVDWCGGKARKVREHIICLINGEIYNIENKTYLAFGGGCSADKAERLANEKIDGVKQWWEQELPTEEDFENARNNLKKAGNTVDYVITHSAPSGVIDRMRIQCSDRQTIKYIAKEVPLQLELNELAYEISSFDTWFFGHFHIDETFSNFFSTYGMNKTFVGLLYDIIKIGD